MLIKSVPVPDFDEIEDEKDIFSLLLDSEISCEEELQIRKMSEDENTP